MEKFNQNLTPESRDRSEKIEHLFHRLGALDHYALLGVPRDAQVQLIRHAHGLRQMLCRSMTSDRSQPSAGAAKAHAILAAMDLAWEVLSEPARRAEYDRRLAATPAADSSRPTPENFSRAARAQEVFSTPSRAPSAPPPPMPSSLRGTSRPVPESIAPQRPQPSQPHRAGVLSALADVIVGGEPAPAARTTIRPPPMPREAGSHLSQDSLRPPRAASGMGPVTDAPSASATHPEGDPWTHVSDSVHVLRDEIDVLCSALLSALSALSAHRPDDASLDDARRGVGRLQVRHAVQAAHNLELQGEWARASRAWMSAARSAPVDPWLLAHAARTLLLAKAPSLDVREVAHRALGLDSTNPLARLVVQRLQ